MSAGGFRLDYTDSRDLVEPRELRRLEFDRPEVVIGRHPDCDLVLGGDGISRRHARIVRDTLGWNVIDLGSVNGTRLNGRDVSEQRLRDGDVIALGPEELIFRAAQPSLSKTLQADPVGPVDSMENVPLTTRTINIDEFKRLLEAKIGAGPVAAVAAAIPGRGKVRPATTVRPVAQDWALPVVSRAARALLGATELDDLLGTVMDLVFENLPAERGGLYLRDAETGERTLKVVRDLTEGAAAGTELSISTTIARAVVEQRQSVLYADIGAEADLAAAESIVLNRIRSAMCAPLYSGEGREVGGLLYVDTSSGSTAFESSHLEVLTTLAMLSSVALEQAALRANVAREQEIRSRLERYCPAAVDAISRAGLPDEMHVAECEVSVLFLDICGFTGIAEALEPAEVSRLLNDLFGRLADVVFTGEGTLDKFMGDGMMAIFGAPLAQQNHAERAVAAALEMFERVRTFNREFPDAPEIRIRIGINSGSVIAGDIGSPKRKDYTVIGDAVNVASRLESQVAGPGEIVIGSATRGQLGERFCCEPLPTLALKGKLAEVTPFRVVGAAAGG